MNICVNVLDEMLKNKDDRKLFLDMYCDFTELYNGICQDFFSKILIPGLQCAFDAYNKSHPERNLSFTGSPEKYLFGPLTSLHFSNKYWPDFRLYFEIPTNLSPLIGVFTAKSDKFTEEVSSRLRETYSNLPNAAKKSSHRNAAWVYFNDPYSNFQRRDTIKGVVNDVVNHRAGPENPITEPSFANGYIIDIMAVVKVLDELVDTNKIESS